MKKCLNKKRSQLKLMNTCIHSDVGMLQSFLPAIMGFVVIFVLSDKSTRVSYEALFTFCKFCLFVQIEWPDRIYNP